MWVATYRMYYNKNRVEKRLNGKCAFSLCNLVVYGDYRKKWPKNTLKGVKFVTIS